MLIVQVARIFAVAVVLVLTATGLWAAGAEEAPAAAAEKEMVLDPTTGEMVEAPRYGGTLTYGLVSWGTNVDDWYGHAKDSTGLVNEQLAMWDWGNDRDVWNWRIFAETPAWAIGGALAESWETPDDTTIIFNIRRGVHWHDKAPMNGRELTAEDVEYNFHRYLGNKLAGTAFSEAEPTPAARNLVALPIESVTATDKYTMVVKLEKPNLSAVKLFIGYGWGGSATVMPPEVIEQHGDYQDWRNTVGTGPYELTDVVEGSSRTWTKIPNYWGFDEKYPDNRLPYADEIRALRMAESATRLAALRTGKVDMLGPGASTLRSIDQIESLQRTDPEIKLWSFKFRSDNAFYIVRMDIPPLNDLRVRQALQMALDLETIVATYFKGYGDATPQGHFANDVPGIGTPFEEWPEAVKKTYRYDPEGAEALLDAAGYPRGADGIRFTMSMGYFERYDVSYAQLVAGYWREIGVDTQTDVLAGGSAEVTAIYNDPDQDRYIIRWGEAAFRYGIPDRLTNQFYKGNLSTGHLNDPKYDAMADAVMAATTIEEMHRLAKEINMYITEQHFKIVGPETPQYQATQPWVKGYNGELGSYSEGHKHLARIWIDQEMKEAMGF